MLDFWDVVSKDGRMALPNGPEIISALQQWPSNQQVTIDQLAPLAERGDPAARAMLAYLLGPQTGRWPEGLPYARAAVEDGNSFIAYIYGANLPGQPDPSLRAAAQDFLRVALDESSTVDPFGPILQSVQVGDPNLGQALLEIALEGRPSGARRRWEELIADIEARKAQVDNAAATTAGERDRAVAEMERHVEAISGQRESIERVANQLGVLASRTAGEAIGADYASRAAVIETRATRYTWASIVLALLIAIGATAATIAGGNADVLDDAASKAAVGIPLVALNLYLGRLAAQYRQEALELRHIELQFNTANPYLAALDEDRRKEILAQLAPRFFPGQALPGGPTSDQSADMSQVLAAALVERITAEAATRPRGHASSAPDST